MSDDTITPTLSDELLDGVNFKTRLTFLCNDLSAIERIVVRKAEADGGTGLLVSDPDGGGHPVYASWDPASKAVTLTSTADRLCVSGMASFMFSDLTGLTSLDTAAFDVSQATSMGWMFNCCESLRSVDLSTWDTSGVTDMAWMFAGCTSLESLDLSAWDVSHVGVTRGMFSWCGSLTDLDLGTWDMGSVRDMSRMFYQCVSLKAIKPDVTGWDVSRVKDMHNMFTDCERLSLNLSGWDVSSLIVEFTDDVPTIVPPGWAL